MMSINSSRQDHRNNGIVAIKRLLGRKITKALVGYAQCLVFEAMYLQHCCSIFDLLGVIACSLFGAKTRGYTEQMNY